MDILGQVWANVSPEVVKLLSAAVLAIVGIAGLFLTVASGYAIKRLQEWGADRKVEEAVAVVEAGILKSGKLKLEAVEARVPKASRPQIERAVAKVKGAAPKPCAPE